MPSCEYIQVDKWPGGVLSKTIVAILATQPPWLKSVRVTRSGQATINTGIQHSGDGKDVAGLHSLERLLKQDCFRLSSHYNCQFICTFYYLECLSLIEQKERIDNLELFC